MAKKNVIEKIFGSKVRVKMLTLFLLNSDRQYYVREISRVLSEPINSVRRELKKLEDLGLIKTKKKKDKKYYFTNLSFPYLKEFRAFVLKAGGVLGDIFKNKFKSVKGLKLLVLSGGLVNRVDAQTDVLIVGKFKDKNVVGSLMKNIEKEVGRDLRYSEIDANEYDYRVRVGDRFLGDVLENENIVVIDKRR